MFKIFILMILFNIQNINASHFRGGIIMWKPVSQNANMIVIDVTIKLGWRRDAYSLCTQDTIIGKNLTIGDTGLTVTPGTLTNLFDGVYCTDFSEAENWSYGQKTYQVVYNAPYSGQTHFLIYSGGAWIPLINHAGPSWNLISRVNFGIQNHTGKINQSPITSMSPLIRLKAGCYREIRIPVEDADGDIVRCRWSIGNECGSSCDGARYVELDGANCVLKFNLTQNIGYYALRLQIEDFSSANSTQPLSSIPLEFLVQAVPTNNCTSTQPSFEHPTKDDNTCVAISLNSTYQDIIIVNSNDMVVDVYEIQTVSPPGLLKSPLYKYGNSSSIKYVNLTWTPTTSGLSILCFIGITSDFSTTEQRCISLAVGFNPPVPLTETIYPIGIIFTNQTEWRIRSDQNLTRPSQPSFIKFYEKETNKLAYQVDAMNEDDIKIEDNKVSFKTKNFLKNDKYYYIAFDSGVFTSVLGCKIPSDEISNPQFWTFYVQDCINMKNCSGNGECIGINQCKCDTNWIGPYCDQRVCSSLNNCSSNGFCTDDNTCECNEGWSSDDCSVSSAVTTCNNNESCFKFNCLAIILLVIVIVLILIIIILIVVFKKKQSAANVFPLEPTTKNY